MEREGYDLIALQELWTQEDFDVVKGRAKDAGLLYSRFFYRCVEQRALEERRADGCSQRRHRLRPRDPVRTPHLHLDRKSVV